MQICKTGCRTDMKNGTFALPDDAGMHHKRKKYDKNQKSLKQSSLKLERFQTFFAVKQTFDFLGLIFAYN